MRTILEDIQLQEDPGSLVFGSSQCALTFDARTGYWQAMTVAGIEGSVIAAGSLALDFQVDDIWVLTHTEPALLRFATTIDRERRSAALLLTFRVKDEYELTCRYTLFPGESRLDRSAVLTRQAGGAVKHLGGFRFALPSVTLGDPAECVIDVPGPWWPKTYVAPATPYSQLCDQSLTFHSAPDGGFGLLALNNPVRSVTLAAWMDTGGEVNCVPSLHGDGDRLSFQFDDRRFYRLLPGMAVESDTQRLVWGPGELPMALAKYREATLQTMPLDSPTPAWVSEMVLLEVLPSYFPGGFREIAEKLAFYKDVGFNTLYLMPHWAGEFSGYFPEDLYAINPAYGTADDLKALVRQAHELGLRVLFDMVIHGFSPKSDVPEARPELFCHDEQSQTVLHPTWKSVTTDWASPAYQQYMIDLVLHDLREYDMDGYRVDAASFKGPNWDPNLPYPAYRSGTASPELMQKMLEAMRAAKPEAMLLSEVFGPVFYNVSNLAHDNQTEAVISLEERMDAGEVTAADYKAHLANVFDLLPPGANRVFFARNHDTSWFYHFHGYTPRFLAFDAIHALCAIPEVFAGDPNHPPHPDTEPNVYGFYRKIFSLRDEFPELAGGELLLREVECDNPMVFTALRRLDRCLVLVLVSMSNRQETATVLLPEPPERLTLRDAMTGAVLKPVTAAGTLTLTLDPFQILVGRI